MKLQSFFLFFKRQTVCTQTIYKSTDYDNIYYQSLFPWGQFYRKNLKNKARKKASYKTTSLCLALATLLKQVLNLLKCKCRWWVPYVSFSLPIQASISSVSFPIQSSYISLATQEQTEFLLPNLRNHNTRDINFRMGLH